MECFSLLYMFFWYLTCDAHLTFIRCFFSVRSVSALGIPFVILVVWCFLDSAPWAKYDLIYPWHNSILIRLCIRAEGWLRRSLQSGEKCVFRVFMFIFLYYFVSLNNGYFLLVYSHNHLGQIYSNLSTIFLEFSETTIHMISTHTPWPSHLSNYPLHRQNLLNVDKTFVNLDSLGPKNVSRKPCAQRKPVLGALNP